MSCRPNECLYPNCGCDVTIQDVVESRMEKPTYEDQLAWLDAQGDSLMIRSIKENVIAVRLMEKLDKQNNLQI